MTGRKPRFIRDELLMMVGGGLFTFGALALLGFALDEDGGGEGWIGGLVFTFGLLIGGGVVFRIGLNFRRLEKRLGRLLEVLRTVDRSSLRSLAFNARVNEEEARKGVLYLISHGYVNLRFDPAEDLVFSPAAGGGAWLKLPSTCPNCHAPCPNMVPAGKPPRCGYCDAPLPVQELTPERVSAMPPEAAPAPATSALPSPGHGAFSGSWGLLIVLFIFFWPAGVVYLIKGLKKHGGREVFRG